MRNGLKYLFVFSAGAALGAVAAWQYLKPKYEQMIQEEVNAFKKDWSERDDEEPETMDIEELEQKRDELRKISETYENILEENKYTNVLEKGGSKSMNDDDPYVISPLKFAEQDGDYDVVSLTYYADGVLVDDMGEPIENAANTVGLEFPEHFGEYTDDPDTVYVRNERYMVDYEIQRDLDTYAEAKNRHLNPADDE